jgi:DNA-binding response OmpR family regulator
MRLARTPGQVVPYEALYETNRGPFGAKFKNLQNEMWRLRARVGNDAARFIRTAHGVGYRLGPDSDDSDSDE